MFTCTVVQLEKRVVLLMLRVCVCVRVCHKRVLSRFLLTRRSFALYAAVVVRRAAARQCLVRERLFFVSFLFSAI